jgi:hypothetical protein
MLLTQGRGFAILVLYLCISYFVFNLPPRFAPRLLLSHFLLSVFSSRTRFRDPCPLLSHYLFYVAVALCAQVFAFTFCCFLSLDCNLDG